MSDLPISFFGEEPEDASPPIATVIEGTAELGQTSGRNFDGAVLLRTFSGQDFFYFAQPSGEGRTGVKP